MKRITAITATAAGIALFTSALGHQSADTVKQNTEIQPVEIVTKNITKSVKNTNRFSLTSYTKKVYSNTTGSIPLPNSQMYVDHIFNGRPSIDKERMNKSVLCLARNIFYESRNEPIEGQIAVALITMNRVHNSVYPNDVCRVVYQKTCGLKKGARRGCTAQFSWTLDSKSEKIRKYFKDKKGRIVQSEVDAWARSVIIAADTITSKIPDFTGGAMHYYNYKVANPSWSKSKRFKPVSKYHDGRLGNHRFLIDKYLVNGA